MSKQQKNRPLVDAFPGDKNKAAREIADSAWNGYFTRGNIERVYQELKEREHTKPSGIQGITERAASFLTKMPNRVNSSGLPPTFARAANNIHDMMFGTSGSSGRPFKPFIALRAVLGLAAPSLEPR